MAGTGESPTFVYVSAEPTGKKKVFQDFETFTSHYRFAELNPEFYTSDILSKTQKNIDRKPGEPVTVIANIDENLVPLSVSRAEFITHSAGGRRSRRTLRRHNTLHRNVRRHNVK